MKGKSIFISVVSAAVGAGLMLLALGNGPSSGIEGWVPLNDGIASAMSKQAAQEATKPVNNNAQTTDTAPASGGKGDAAQPVSAETGTVTPAGKTDGSTAEPIEEVPSASAVAAQDQSGLVSINAAGIGELQEIPGIGEKKAQAIVDYRNAHGPFGSVNELTNVKGIGDKLLEKMKPYVRL